MTAPHIKRRTGCVFIPLSARYQSIRKHDFEQQLRSKLGQKHSKEIQCVFRLYGRFDYAIVTESSRNAELFSRMRRALQDHCDDQEQILAFENNTRSSLDTSDVYRIFCQWTYHRLKYRTISAHYKRLTKLQNHGLVFDFLSHDDSNIILSVASQKFKELDTVTDFLDATKLGKKETLVVSSSGSDKGVYNEKAREEGLRKALHLDVGDQQNLSSKKK